MGLNVPETITAGDSVVFYPTDLRGNDPATGRCVDFNPADHTIVLLFSTPNSSSIQVTADDDSGGYKVTLTPSITSQLPEGTVFWHSIVRNSGGLENTFANGRVQVAADPRSAVGQDTRSIAEKQLEAVEKAILARANGTEVEEYYIGTRRVRNMTLQDLMALRNELRTTVARERSIAKGVNPSTGYVTFQQPGVDSLRAGERSWF